MFPPRLQPKPSAAFVRAMFISRKGGPLISNCVPSKTATMAKHSPFVLAECAMTHMRA